MKGANVPSENQNKQARVCRPAKKDGRMKNRRKKKNAAGKERRKI